MLAAFKSALASPSLALGSVLSLSIGIALSQLPLTAALDADSAFVLSAALSLLAMLVSLTMRLRAPFPTVRAVRHVSVACLLPAWLALVGISAVSGNLCLSSTGILFHLTGPLLSVVLGAAFAQVLGSVVRTRSLGWFLCLSAYGADVAQGFVTFMRTPTVVPVGHFWSLYPGTPYDLNVEFNLKYLGARLLTLCVTALALALCASHRARKPAYGVALFVLFAAQGFGAELGIDSTSSDLQKALARRSSGTRCTVYTPLKIPPEQALRLQHDCEYQMFQTEAFFGIRYPHHIQAYFFESAKQKKAFIGAGNTYVAKPWRREVYLQLQGWPHPVLKHEIAHVIAGHMSSNLLKVPGLLGGMMPYPALIEGFAVAADWDRTYGLDAHQWARLLWDLDMGISPLSMMGPDFIFSPSNRAYTLAGSFIRFLWDRRGPKPLRELYSHGDFSSAYGTRASTLVSDWRTFLQTVSLPPEAETLAKARFSTRAVFQVRCARTLGRLEVQQADAYEAGATQDFMALCQKASELAPQSSSALMQKLRALALTGALSRARRVATQVRALSKGNQLQQAWVLELLGDAAFRSNRAELASRTYLKARHLNRVPHADSRLNLKLLAASAPDKERLLLRALVLSPTHLPSARVRQYEAARRLAQLREDGLGEHFLGALLMHDGLSHLAAEPLTRAVKRGGPHPEDTLALFGEANFAARDMARAKAAWMALSRSSNPTMRSRAQDWLERISYVDKAHADNAGDERPRLETLGRRLEAF